MADLTNLDSVKQWQGIDTATTSEDGVLSSLISATSADFLRAIGRLDLLSTTYTENRIGDGSRRMVLRHWPVTGVTLLKLGSNAVPAQNPSTDGWYLDSDADPERQFVLYLSGALTFTDASSVVVEYTAGYEDLPDDVAQAVTEWVAFRYSRKGTEAVSQSRGIEGESVHYDEGSAPASVLRVIAAYKRKFAAYGTDAADTALGEDAPAQRSTGRARAGNR